MNPDSLSVTRWLQLLSLWRAGVIGWFAEAKRTYRLMGALLGKSLPPFKEMFPEEALLAYGEEKKINIFDAIGMMRR